MKLYELIAEIENFEFDIDEETGEITNADDLDKLEVERNAKIENVALWIKNLKAEAEALKNEKDAFAKRQRAAENKMESLMGYLTRNLDGNKFKTDKVAISFRKSEQVNCIDPKYVDDDYLTYKEPALNKTKVKAALKQGVNIPGCSLVEKQNIQIK